MLEELKKRAKNIFHNNFYNERCTPSTNKLALSGSFCALFRRPLDRFGTAVHLSGEIDS